jgi:hypothetical protein
MMRYRLRTLLIVLALGPMAIWLTYCALALVLVGMRGLGGLPGISW